MSDETHSLLQLVKQDDRYPVEAYFFIRDALAFAADSMELGKYSETAIDEPESLEPTLKQSRRERHLTGQELCEAIRRYAINQYGYMAKIVLNRWGISQTGDFGEIVYNMINVGIMKKSSQDRRSHFDNVYDFDDVFECDFEMCNSNTSGRS